jgi:hypothetical protein
VEEAAMTSKAWLAAGLLALSPGAFGAGSADDDLAVVRKAVALSTPSPAASRARDEREPAPARKDREPRWLKVRVRERSGKRVSINLPLNLARAVGDIPFDFGCGRHRCQLTVGDVLRYLETGQELVQVDNEEATVRVWVE